jgi:two-component system sensor histidine kinase YesM
MKQLMMSIANSRLHTKLMFTFVLVVVIPVVVLGLSDFQLSRKTILDMAQNDVHTIVLKNNQIVDAKLVRAREMIYGFSGDSDVYDILSNLYAHDETAILQADLRMKSIMAKYFGQSMDIYSVQLVTPYFTFGTASSANSEHAKNFIPYNVFPQTELYRQAWNGEGQTIWHPTYDFAEMYQLDYLRDMEYDFKYLFSAVTLINGTYTQNRDFRHLAEKPILVVNFKDVIYRDVFAGSLPVADAVYFVVDDTGQVVYHSNRGYLASRMESPILEMIRSSKDGVKVMDAGDGEYVIAYARSEITGWTSVAMIPPAALLHPILTRYMQYAVIIAISVMILFIGLSYALTRLITEPLHVMLRAIANTGEGRFHTEFRKLGSQEFNVVMRKFSEMNEKIQRLIQDKYQSEIREKEAHIKALNLKLDPHFMYNTLNMISLLALEKEEYEISDIVISLSNMMKYLVRNDTALVPLATDLMYLKSYITIMSKRFEGTFHVEYDLDESLDEIIVPKFFLQPLVENACIHGFKQMKSGGLLRISSRRDGDDAKFTVEDNGCGIPEGQLALILTQSSKVGLSNVNERIKACFGGEYGMTIHSREGEGTKITIVVPCREEVADRYAG